MASVYRADTHQFLGYLVELHGPLPPGTESVPFHAWRHPDGTLRHEPPVSTDRGRLTVPPFIELCIPVRNIENPDVHVVIPPELLDFILHHGGFRPAPPKVG